MVRRYGDEVWLIRDGRRSLINQGARAVLLALGLGEDAVSAARPMSRALFDAIPVGPRAVGAGDRGAGSPARFAGAPGPVGTVVSTPQVGGQTAYSVVLADGMQPVPAVVAQVLQNAGPVGPAVPVVAGPGTGQVAGCRGVWICRHSRRLPPHVVDSELNSAACWHWEKVAGESMATTSIIIGPTIPVADSQVDKVVELVRSSRGGAASRPGVFRA